MKNDSFFFFRQTIEQATVEARFDMAHNRTAAIRSFELFCSKDSTNRMQIFAEVQPILYKDELPFNELSTDLFIYSLPSNHPMKR